MSTPEPPPWPPGEKTATTAGLTLSTTAARSASALRILSLTPWAWTARARARADSTPAAGSQARLTRGATGKRMGTLPQHGSCVIRELHSLKTNGPGRSNKKACRLAPAAGAARGPDPPVANAKRQARADSLTYPGLGERGVVVQV